MMKILVTGATGTQGGAVIDHLLSGEYGEFDIYGLTRDNESERAVALSDRGVHVVTGDMSDEDRMRDLCAGMDGVFCVTTPFELGPEFEVQQGVAMADAAAAESVSHFVYTSVGGADADSGVPHLESKWAVEQYLHDLDIPWTILRPVFFMQNLQWNAAEIAEGRLAMPLEADVELAMVHADDIGQAAATAFAHPETAAGATVNLVGDSLTLEEMTAVLSTALDRSIEPVHLDIDAFRADRGEELAVMYAWFNEVGYDEEFVPADSTFGIHFHSFADFCADAEAFRPAPAAA